MNGSRYQALVLFLWLSWGGYPISEDVPKLPSGHTRQVGISPGLLTWSPFRAMT